MVYMKRILIVLFRINLVSFDQETDAIISKIAVLFRKYRVSIYDPQRRRGEIRHILIRRAVKTNQTLVVIVSNEAIFKGSKNCNQLVKAFPSIKIIVLSMQIKNRQALY